MSREKPHQGPNMLLVACWPQQRPQTSVGGHWPGRKLRPDLPPNAKGPSPAQRAYPGRPGKHVKPTHNGTQTQQRGCAAPGGSHPLRSPNAHLLGAGFLLSTFLYKRSCYFEEENGGGGFWRNGGQVVDIQGHPALDPPICNLTLQFTSTTAQPACTWGEINPVHLPWPGSPLPNPKGDVS